MPRILAPLLVALLALSFAGAAHGGATYCTPGGSGTHGPDRQACAGYEEVGRPGLVVHAGAYDRTYGGAGVVVGVAKIPDWLVLGHVVCIHNGLTSQSICLLKPDTWVPTCPGGPLGLCL